MRAAAIFVALALAAGCGGGDSASPPATLVDRTRAVPADVRAFLDRVVEPSTVAFTAGYRLLNRNGGREHAVHVESDPPTLAVTIDGEAVDLTDDRSLAPYGIFSGFLAANPKAAIMAAARRADAGAARFSTQTAAGGALDCVEIPIQGEVASRWCLTTIGIFGFVDTPSVRYELTGALVAVTAGR